MNGIPTSTGHPPTCEQCGPESEGESVEWWARSQVKQAAALGLLIVGGVAFGAFMEHEVAKWIFGAWVAGIIVGLIVWEVLDHRARRRRAEAASTGDNA